MHLSLFTLAHFAAILALAEVYFNELQCHVTFRLARTLACKGASRHFTA